MRTKPPRLPRVSFYILMRSNFARNTYKQKFSRPEWDLPVYCLNRTLVKQLTSNLQKYFIYSEVDASLYLLRAIYLQSGI